MRVVRGTHDYGTAPLSLPLPSFLLPSFPLSFLLLTAREMTRLLASVRPARFLTRTRERVRARGVHVIFNIHRQIRADESPCAVFTLSFLSLTLPSARSMPPIEARALLGASARPRRRRTASFVARDALISNSLSGRKLLSSREREGRRRACEIGLLIETNIYSRVFGISFLFYL